MKKEEYKKAVQERYNLDQGYFQLIDNNEEPSEELMTNCYRTRAICIKIINYCQQRGIEVDLNKL
ncbi:hypothetical protein GF312_16230 [Candidatus Poribacteria bacterium]|nr:hypothetical protein [Candidatus Poribacteria bacterium]